MWTVPEKWDSYKPASLRLHWAHVSWAKRGPYTKDSSQAFISVWLTVLSPQWPAPGTCHRGLWDYLSVNQTQMTPPPVPQPFPELTMQVLANSLHLPLLLISDSQFPHRDDISLHASLSQQARCMLTINPTYCTVRLHEWITALMHVQL